MTKSIKIIKLDGVGTVDETYELEELGHTLCSISSTKLGLKDPPTVVSRPQ